MYFGILYIGSVPDTGNVKYEITMISSHTAIVDKWVGVGDK
jgi:hypothetical protein